MRTRAARPSGSPTGPITTGNPTNSNTGSKEHPYGCPLCFGGNASYRDIRHRDGRMRAALHCQSAACKSMGKRYIHELAEAVGAPDMDALKDDPHRWLAKVERPAN